MDHPKKFVHRYALESIEMRIACTEADDEVGADGKRKHLVSFWTYTTTRDEAMEEILLWIKEALNLLPDELIKIAACDHEWYFVAGEKSEIGCGHHG